MNDPFLSHCGDSKTDHSHLSFLLLQNLLYHCFYDIGWDRKTDAIGGGIGLGIDGAQGRDADELPLQIDQGPAAIAGIQGGVGLDGIGEGGSG